MAAAPPSEYGGYPILAEVWTRIARTILPSSVPLDALFVRYVGDPYTSPPRRYHTLAHVAAMLTELSAYKTATRPSWAGGEKELSLLLAVVFHDVVYDPKSKTNEHDSVLALQTFLREARQLATSTEGGDATSDWHDSPKAADYQREVSAYIAATADHWGRLSKSYDPSTGTVASSDDPLDVLLDLDVAVLGWPGSDYARYAHQVREEFEHLSEEAFRQGRSAFLTSALERPQLYKTKYFYDRYETSARKNMQEELARLTT